MDPSRTDVLKAVQDEFSVIKIFDIWSGRKIAFAAIPGDRILILNGRHQVGYRLSVSMYQSSLNCVTYSYDLFELYGRRQMK